VPKRREESDEEEGHGTVLTESDDVSNSGSADKLDTQILLPIL